jgi:membrane-bound lytic murein transglycosylase A
MKKNHKAAILGLIASTWMLVSCATQPEQPARQQVNGLTPVAFGDLDGWSTDTPGETLKAFKRSCTQIAAKPAEGTMGVAGRMTAWQSACKAAKQVGDSGGDDAARTFFENNFHPYGVSGMEGSTGLFTGYYAPELMGSTLQGGPFQTPLYARPFDLVSADLGLFKNSLQGQHVVGKVADMKFIPYDSRADIARGSLDERARPIVWVQDPVAAFFLEVQGSGRVHLQDGTHITVGYDGTNGHPYIAIGHTMADRGELERPVTMPAIKQWLSDHPAQAQDILNRNPSYVFFKTKPDDQIVGAEGVQLTPERSIAVDPAYMPLGAPVWIDTTDGHGQPLRRLVVAQDTGGAIKGVVRADFFWGDGDEAGAQAGAMQSQGRYYILIPNGAFD